MWPNLETFLIYGMETVKFPVSISYPRNFSGLCHENRKNFRGTLLLLFLYLLVIVAHSLSATRTCMEPSTSMVTLNTFSRNFPKWYSGTFRKFLEISRTFHNSRTTFLNSGTTFHIMFLKFLFYREKIVPEFWTSGTFSIREMENFSNHFHT